MVFFEGIHFRLNNAKYQSYWLRFGTELLLTKSKLIRFDETAATEEVSSLRDTVIGVS